MAPRHLIPSSSSMTQKADNTAMLTLYNTLTKKLEPFIPQDPQHVTMYVCGVTTYDYCHLGHARSFIVFDTLFRWLQVLYPRVSYTRNITDIDDKIIQRAATYHCSPEALCARYIQAMREDTEALAILTPTHEPKATEHITQVIEHIQLLCAQGYAYQSDDGDVHYAIDAFTPYGHLSGKKKEDLVAGQRIEVNTAKKNPLDFVLWKSAKPGEPQWPSPFGPGRPGWHIECTCMSHQTTTGSLDIHGGGLDLQFPHHENEIAQGEPIFGAPYAHYWVHNGFVTVGQDKMSKSLNNFVTIRDLLKIVHPEAIRLFMLKTEYRKPLNYQLSYLKESAQALAGLYRAIQSVPSTIVLSDTDWSHPTALQFRTAMNQNLSTPEAIALLFELATHINKSQSYNDAVLLKQLAGHIGLLKENTDNFLHWMPPTQKEDGERLITASYVEQRLAERREAKMKKDYTSADAIRQQLLEQGIIIEDTPQGTTWRRTSYDAS